MKVNNFIKNQMDYVESIQDKKLVLYSAGTNTEYYLNNYFKHGEVSFICDSNPDLWGTDFYGIKVYSPDILKENPQDYVVIITPSSFVTIDFIIESLKEIGVYRAFDGSVLFNINCFWRYNGKSEYNFHELNTFKIISENQDKIDKVSSLLCDEKSKEIYEELAFNLKYNLKYYIELCDEWHGHYFNNDFFTYSENEVFVDGGTFDGADAINFAKITGDKFKKAYCFEPDRNNFTRACKNLYKHIGGDNLKSNDLFLSTDKFDIYEAGLYNENKKMDFSLSGNYGARFIETDGDIPVLGLDDLLFDKENVTFIKLDVEGVEYKTLEGAKKIIMRDKPKLAISIYHKIEDLWELPLLLHSYVPEYKFYVRHHSLQLGDKVLYVTL